MTSTPTSLERLARIVGSLTIVVVLYGVYALAAVPLIEPPAAERQQVDLTEAELRDGGTRVYAQREELKVYGFQEGDWELNSPKVLESPQGILLLNTYEKLDSGRVKLHPCTMIFQPQGSLASEEDRRRRSVIVRCPEGAILQFEGGIDLKRAKIGKLIAGQLTGVITIHSDQKEPGPHDDLLVLARDLNLVQQQITSPHPVNFTLGPNRGSGRDLKIQLAPSGSQQGFRGVLSLELATAVEARIVPGGADVFPGSTRPNTPAQDAAGSAEPPVDIRCQGPFRFDFEKNVATFHDQVEVLRLHTEGPNDQMICDQLSMHFASTRVPALGASSTEGGAADAPSQNVKLEPVRMEAMGSPVVITAPSRDVEARARQVDYDIRSGAATLRDDYEARLRQGSREISARQLFFEPDESRQLGKFLATGRGWLKGTLPEDESQSFEAQWSRQLQFRPQDEYHVLSVEGAAHIHAPGKGTLDGDAIHLWLIKAPDEPAARAERMARNDDSRPKVRLLPDRLLAVGSVIIDSPQITGKTGQLQTWFEHVAPPAAPGPAGVSDPLANTPLQGPAFGDPNGRMMVQLPPGPPAEMVPAPPPVPLEGPALSPFRATTQSQPVPPSLPPYTGPVPAAESTFPAADPPREPRQRYDIQAGTLRVRARVVGHKTELAKVVAEHKVRLEEIRTANEGDKPLLVVGQYMELEQPSPEQAVATVKGEPGFLEARGMTLTSSVIHVDRGRSALWTDGPGKLTLPADRNFDGQASNQPQQLEITWQGTMDFGGQTARFSQGVLARLGLQSMRTEQLEANFTQPIQLGSRHEAAPGARNERPQLDTVLCRQGTLLESRTFDGQRLMAVDRLQTADMIVHQRTGDVEASGPGSLVSTRIDSGGDGFAAPGTLPAATALAEEKLVYLHVKFQRGMTGNLQRRVMGFEGQVRTIYGPIPQWEAQLDVDRRETWGERGIVLATERLSVAEMGTGPDNKPAYEMEAQGNTTVEGNSFLARALRVTYAQAKDLLVLEGDGRTDAQLYRRARPGDPPSDMSANKIMFWPKTNRAEVYGPNYMDLNGLGGNKR